MSEINPDAIQVAVYGTATMGALTAVILIVNSLKKLLTLTGQNAVRLTFGVALYVAITIYCAVYLPELSVVLGIIILTALLAAGADAIVSQGKTANSDGIEALKAHKELDQQTDEHPTVDAYVPDYGSYDTQTTARYKSER